MPTGLMTSSLTVEVVPAGRVIRRTRLFLWSCEHASEGDTDHAQLSHNAAAGGVWG